MDLSKQFSFTDFLAYFFPGAFAVVGIYLLLLLSPAQVYLANLNLDITTGLVFLIFSYIIGVILSSSSSAILKRIEKLLKYQDQHNFIPSHLFPDEVMSAFREVMELPKDKEIKWTYIHYQICLALILEKMPSSAQHIERQRNIALFRRNLISPLIIWGITGIVWGINEVLLGIVGWGWVFIVISLILSWVSTVSTVKRMHHGVRVEIRETLSAFLAGYKLGVFSKPK